MELTESVKTLLIDTEKQLKGSARRIFRAKVVKILGRGGQRLVEKEMGWNRGTIRKGMHELKSGLQCVDAFSFRGRKKIEDHLPHLLEDIKAIVDPQSHTDPTFKTTKLYSRLSAKEVRKQLIKKGHSDDQLPTERTISNKLNALGYNLKKVAKCKPTKKIKETDKIFQRLHVIHEEAAKRKEILRISMDAKATVKIGPFSRGGYTRNKNSKGSDHDFKAKALLNLYGIFLPEHDEIYHFFTESKVTSDFMIDSLEEIWPDLKNRFNPNTLLINLDNGPENHSRRTQFLKRIVDFSYQYCISIRLAYYPPYHSKYNPIERTWAILENHWNGEILDEIETAINFAETMTWNGKNPKVTFVKKDYKTGIKLSKAEMEAYEKKVLRIPGLEKWFVDIPVLV